MVALAVRGDHIEQRAFGAAAIAHGHFFGGGKRPRRGTDDQRAVGRGETVADLPSGFQQLGRHQRIQSPRQRVQAQHRQAPLQLAVGLGVNFQVISGGAGALRHAGDGGGLGRIARVARHIDQPVGQYAAAFAAQGAQQNGNRLGHGVSLNGANQAGCSQRVASPCQRAHRRSCSLGFCTTSAR